MAELNLENKLYGLRHIAAYLQQLQHTAKSDDDLTDQLLFLGIVALRGGLRKSQLAQDIFALSMSGFKSGGYFVEVGAHHSSSLSNSWLLEKEHGWNGLLVEPNPDTYKNLLAERSAILVKKAAWGQSGQKLTFNVTADTALSTLANLKQTDLHDRSNFKSVSVETITLNDALDSSGAPDVIDYVSIDVEGAELAVLDGLDLNKRDIRSFTIEFNHDAERLSAYDERLLKAGYRRVLSMVSDFDAWYVKPAQYEEWRKTIGKLGV